MFRATPTQQCSEDDDNASAIETQANIFAAALLMPADLVRHEFGVLPIINKLAQKFNVSREAMGHRLANLSL
jgi:Zn-dependent peptidase ImmA (M78 family)